MKDAMSENGDQPETKLLEDAKNMGLSDHTLTSKGLNLDHKEKTTKNKTIE